MNTAHKINVFESEMRRIATTIKSGITGPLIIAEDVVKMASRWEIYREAAGGLEPSAAFKKWLLFNLHYFVVRHAAVTLLGRDVRTWMEDTLAVRLAAIPAPLHVQIKEALLLKFNAQRKRGHPVTLNQAEPLIRHMLGKSPKRGCEECARLKALLEKHGIKDE